MEIKEVAERLIHSTEFVKWKKNHPNSFFADAFMIYDEIEKSHWQIGYYDKDEKKITVFVMEDVIMVNESEEVFKKEGDKVLEVNLNNVKLGVDDVKKKLRELCILEYPKEKIVKSIFILQTVKFGQIWNITNVTENFKTLNVKMDTATGQILEHKIVSLFQFRK